MQGLYDVSTIYVSINIFSLLHKHPVIQLQLARGRKKLLLFRWQSLDLERSWMYIWLYVYMDDNNNNNIDNNITIVSCFHKEPQLYKVWVFSVQQAQLFKAQLIKLILDKWKF
mgnify:CR=1 FL=1